LTLVAAALAISSVVNDEVDVDDEILEAFSKKTTPTRGVVLVEEFEFGIPAGLITIAKTAKTLDTKQYH
jgi:hypothetical protein